MHAPVVETEAGRHLKLGVQDQPRNMLKVPPTEKGKKEREEGATLCPFKPIFKAV